MFRWYVINTYSGHENKVTQGEVGAQGVQGLSAFEVWQSQPGNENRTVEEFFATLTGPQGPTGEVGPQGIQGPQGDVGPQGVQGLSAFEVWQTLPGNENRTIEEFYLSITGAPGPQGPPGVPGLDVWPDPVTGETAKLSTMTPKQTLTSQATCPVGTILVGGGGRVIPTDPGDLTAVAMDQSYPSDNRTWTVVGVARNTLNQGMRVLAYAICTKN